MEIIKIIAMVNIDENIEKAKTKFEIVNQWITNCDTKSSILLAFYGVLLTLVFTSELQNMISNTFALETSLKNIGFIELMNFISLLSIIAFIVFSILCLLSILFAFLEKKFSLSLSFSLSFSSLFFFRSFYFRLLRKLFKYFIYF